MTDNVIILNRTPDDWRRIFRRWLRSGTTVSLIVLLLILVVVGNPFFVVGPTEQGVVLRFGRHVRTVPPGLGLKFPWPVEKVIIVDVQQVRRLTVGFQNTEDADFSFRMRTQQVPNNQGELMLTADENIILVKLSVQYRVKDPVDYLFNVNEPEEALHDICEASLRKAIGDSGVDMALTEGKAEIEEEIRRDSQSLSDRYGLGVEITSVNLRDVQPPGPVQKAFKDVISAREIKQQIINAAMSYRNAQIPKAEGKAAEIINEASAYARERVLRAQGEVAKFSALLDEYRKAEEVTRDRLYLETLEEVLGGVGITVIDRDVESILPLLNLSPGEAGTVENPGQVPPTQGGFRR